MAELLCVSRMFSALRSMCSTRSECMYLWGRIREREGGEDTEMKERLLQGRGLSVLPCTVIQRTSHKADM